MIYGPTGSDLIISKSWWGRSIPLLYFFLCDPPAEKHEQGQNNEIHDLLIEKKHDHHHHHWYNQHHHSRLVLTSKGAFPELDVRLNPQTGTSPTTLISGSTCTTQFWWGHWRSWSWWRWWRWWEPGALLPSLRQRRDKLPQLPTLDLSSQLHCDDDVDDDDGDVNDGNDDDCQSCHKFLSVIKKERKGSWWLWAEGRCVAIFCCFIALLWRLMSKCSAAGRPGYSFIIFFSLHLCHCQFLHLCQFKFSIFVTANILQMKLRLMRAIRCRQC